MAFRILVLHSVVRFERLCTGAQTISTFWLPHGDVGRGPDDNVTGRWLQNPRHKGFAPVSEAIYVRGRLR